MKKSSKKSSDDKIISLDSQQTQLEELTAQLNAAKQTAETKVLKRANSRQINTRAQIEQEVAERYEAAIRLIREDVANRQAKIEALQEQNSNLSAENVQYKDYTERQTNKLTKQKSTIKELNLANSAIKEELTDVSEQLFHITTTVETAITESRDLKIANESLVLQVVELKTVITENGETVQNATKTKLELSDKTREYNILQASIDNKLEDQAKLHQQALEEEKLKSEKVTGILSLTQAELASVKGLNLDITQENSTLKETTTQQAALINGALAALQAQIPPLIEKLKEGSRAIPLAKELLEGDGYQPEQISAWLAGNDDALTAPPETVKAQVTTPQRNQKAKEDAERLLGFSLTTSSSAAPKESTVTSALQFTSLSDSDSDDEKESKPTATRQPSSVAGKVSSNEKGVTSTTSQQKTGSALNR